MKKIILILLLLYVSLGFAQPKITDLSFRQQVDIFGLFEVSFALSDYDNPYDPEVIDAWAEFNAPDGRAISVIAFYYEDYGFREEGGVEIATRKHGGDCWKVRFTPDIAGRWSYTIHAVDRQGERQSETLTFDCKVKEGAKGFVSVANAKYLRQEVFVSGQKRYRSFFPVGPNVAWYSAADHGTYKKPYGFYEYERHIDAMSGNCNYLRLWINRYQFLSIYGPEHTERENGLPVMYFDSKLNQKDSAELDHIVDYALAHGINLMPCIFNFRNFQHKEGTSSGTKKHPAMPGDWVNNPYHTVLGLDSPYRFFSDAEAKRITRNLLRYIVARWGYATNVMAWELWNEVANMADGNPIDARVQHDIITWHSEMADYLRSIDPFGHPITTSIGSVKGDNLLLPEAFKDLDIAQDHNYQNIQKAQSSQQFSHILLNKSDTWRRHCPKKPFFMGEFGFGQGSSKPKYADKDPYGFDLHNSLWSSLFSGSMGPASFWYWDVMDSLGWYRHYHPIVVFCQRLPVLSENFTATTTGVVQGSYLVFPNGLDTYYMMNETQDTLMGWCQDDAYNYQSLRRLTDRMGNNGHFAEDGVFDPNGYVYTKNPLKKPLPTMGSNSISVPIDGQPVGTRYEVRWFNTETGLEMTSEATTATVQRRWFRKWLTFEFPSSVRDYEAFRIKNTYGDAAFMIYKAGR